MATIAELATATATATDAKVTTAAAVGRVVAYLKSTPDAWADFAGEDAPAIMERVDAHLASLRRARAASKAPTPAQAAADRAIEALTSAMRADASMEALTVMQVAAWVSKNAPYACGEKVAPDGGRCTTQKAASICKRAADAGKMRRLVVGKSVYYAVA